MKQKTIIKNGYVRYPNLSTVIMIEKFLEKHGDFPVKLAELKKRLPKQVMYQTLHVTLEYLFRSGKIMYGPKGIQWIYKEPAHLKMMMKGSLEI